LAAGAMNPRRALYRPGSKRLGWILLAWDFGSAGALRLPFAVADELVKPDVCVFEAFAPMSESLALIMLIMRDHA